MSGIHNRNEKMTTPMTKKKKKKKTKLTICSIVIQTMLLLVVIETFAYTSLTLPRIDDDDSIHNHNHNANNHKYVQVEREKIRKRQQKQQQEKWRVQHLHDQQDQDVENQKLNQLYQEQLELELTDTQKLELSNERAKTVTRLQQMGVNETIDNREVPPWSQILQNFNSIIPNNKNKNNSTHPNVNENDPNTTEVIVTTTNDEPVIIGLEYCEDFRAKYDTATIANGPAGMFSTGTNLIAKLMKTNCDGPHHRRHGFSLIQVPWGKHNPADARTHNHIVVNPKVKNHDAVMPIVAIRHPYTWMSAMCRHSYQTRWKHIKDKCDETLNLTSPILGVPYGFKQYNETIPNQKAWCDTKPCDTQYITHNVTNYYPSLAHMWVDWYQKYYLDTDTPRIMVRHEDLVYRPEKVIRPICECLGGTVNSATEFLYAEESANAGKGHGKQRSGLVTAVIKYGQPLADWYKQYTASDRAIMKSVFQGGSHGNILNPKNGEIAIEEGMQDIYATFQYTLYEDITAPARPAGWKTKLNPILNKKTSEQQVWEANKATREWRQQKQQLPSQPQLQRTERQRKQRKQQQLAKITSY